MIVVAGFSFSQFFALFSWLIAIICLPFLLLQNIFVRPPIYQVQCRQDRGGHCLPKKKYLLNDFFNLLYLKLSSENILKTRLVISEKYKLSFLS